MFRMGKLHNLSTYPKKLFFIEFPVQPASVICFSETSQTSSCIFKPNFFFVFILAYKYLSSKNYKNHTKNILITLSVTLL